MGQQPVLLLFVVLVVSGAMVARLAWLQLVQGGENKARADENRIRLMPRNPIRGRILDRHGDVLASSRLTYNLYLQPRQVSDTHWPALRDRLATVLAVGAASLDQARAQGANPEGFRIPLMAGLTSVQVLCTSKADQNMLLHYFLSIKLKKGINRHQISKKFSNFFF